jgi:trehalose synthase
MSGLTQVEVAPEPVERFRDLLGADYAEVEAGASHAREFFAGRVIWQVNSTARGGGVAEMLRTHLAYVRAVGIDVRWVLAGGGDDFFAVTKRIHNNLHGSAGDGGDLGPAERAGYERGLEATVTELARVVKPGDIAFLHDPQTLGLIGPMREVGAHVLWRCHIGVDEPNEIVRRTWRFLQPYVSQAHACIFSREQYVWEDVDPTKVTIVPPSIDPFSPKNQELASEAVEAILDVAGVGPDGRAGPSVFKRSDDTPGRVDRPGEMIQESAVPAGAPLVSQVSRWDSLKDPVGLIDCFTEHVLDPAAHLLLAGPDVKAVADDPEGAAVLEEVIARRAALDTEARARVHLAMLPLDDIEENAAIINAVQRRSQVVVQKSIAEGFGLTVSEAMWKGTPVVASRVGGIQDQIVDGESGLMLEPRDLPGFGAAISALLDDRARAERLGAAGRERVAEKFLVTGRLLTYFQVFLGLLSR